MDLIENLSSDANQKTKVVLEDGSILVLQLIFMPAVSRWILNLSHPKLTVNGINLCIFPNILRPWKNLIDFGLACYSEDSVDPFQIDDFSSGRVRIYIVPKLEISAMEENIFGVLS